jgi:hypothetical protein
MVMSKSVERRLKVQKGCECGENCDCALPDESDIIMSNLVEKMLMEAIEKYHLINEDGDVKADTKKLPQLMRKYGLNTSKPTEEIETEMVDAFEQGVLPLVDHLKV